MRVKGFAPEAVWRRRYRHIREFERMLGDEGTHVVKLFLNISKDEQRLRLQDRIDDPDERWKFRVGDLDDRALWDDYQAAFRRRAPRDLDRDRAVVRRARRSQVGAQPRRSPRSSAITCERSTRSTHRPRKASRASSSVTVVSHRRLEP